VLRRMAKEGYISDQDAERGYSKGLALNRGTRYTKIREPFFFDYVKQQLIEKYGINTVRRGGLKIHTTIDPHLQEAGREAINSNLGYPDDPSAAVVTIDPQTGYIKAMASSGAYQHKQFNLAAQGHRQPGSAFKPMVLTTAIRRGVNPETTSYTSKPLNLNIPGYGPWEVHTYGDQYGGTMNLVKATLASDNTVFAQLDVDLGPDAVRETAYDMGIETKLDGVPSEGLGGLRLGVSPLEMANAYATLASGGMRNTPTAIRRIEFPDGHVEQQKKPKRERAFSDGVTYEVTKILEKNIQAGTGTRAQIGCPAAGKTGTTDDFNDAWFAGYTPELATAVWVGYPDALREMRSVHGIEVAGGTFPAQIWGAYMQTAKGDFCGSFPSPSDPVEWSSFHGSYASSSSSGYGDDYNSSAGEGDYRGYDPRFYGPGAGQGPSPSPKPQRQPNRPSPSPAPQPQPSPAPAPDTGGGGTGGGGQDG
jgi:penicillin-binding protein 1A